VLGENGSRLSRGEAAKHRSEGPVGASFNVELVSSHSCSFFFGDAATPVHDVFCLSPRRCVALLFRVAWHLATSGESHFLWSPWGRAPKSLHLTTRATVLLVRGSQGESSQLLAQSTISLTVVSPMHAIDRPTNRICT
jgi:hypothetical protein